jgi:hypothetical protein
MNSITAEKFALISVITAELSTEQLGEMIKFMKQVRRQKFLLEQQKAEKPAQTKQPAQKAETKKQPTQKAETKKQPAKEVEQKLEKKTSWAEITDAELGPSTVSLQEIQAEQKIEGEILDEQDSFSDFCGKKGCGCCIRFDAPETEKYKALKERWQKDVLYLGHLCDETDYKVLRQQITDVLGAGCKAKTIFISEGANFAYVTFATHGKATKAFKIFQAQPEKLTKHGDIVVNFAVDKRN